METEEDTTASERISSLWQDLLDECRRCSRGLQSANTLWVLLELAELLLKELREIVNHCLQEVQPSSPSLALSYHLRAGLGLVSSSTLGYRDVDVVPKEYVKFLSDVPEKEDHVREQLDFKVEGDRFICRVTDCATDGFVSFPELKQHFDEEHRALAPLPEGFVETMLALEKGDVKVENVDPSHIKEEAVSEEEETWQEEEADDYVPEEKKFRGQRRVPKSSSTAKSRRFACWNCPLRFTTEKALDRHAKSHDEEEEVTDEPLQCKDCDFLATQPSDLRRHRRDAKHKKRSSSAPVPCEVCGKVFSNKALCRQHQDTHNTANDSICDLCGKGFKNKRYLMGHIKSVHSNDTYLCTDCGKSFRQQSGYRSHRALKHSAVPPERSQCEFCEKTFITKTTMRLHQAIVHGKGDVLHCERCPTKFVSESKLREHMMAKHLGIKHPCPHCNKDFNHKFSMKKHVRDGKCPALKIKTEANFVGTGTTTTSSTAPS